MSGRLLTSGEPGEEPAPLKIDTSVAHIARVYDYWLGGKDNYAADREAGEVVTQFYPHIHSGVLANRAFLARTVRYLAGTEGVRQFLDIGTGLPSASNTHEVAQAVAPESRIVYVDNDPVVLTHARALLRSGPEGATAYLDADARDPARILTEAARLLDFARPVAVMLVAILHVIDDADNPGRIVADLMAAVPSGSFLVISHVPSDMHQEVPRMAESAARLSQLMAQRLIPRSREQVTGFFAGLRLIEPGVVPIQQWRPDTDAEAHARTAMWGGVARKA